MPFPTTELIHRDWSRLHQPVVVGSMNAVCTVVDPEDVTGATYDDATGVTSGGQPRVIVPDGTPCRVQRIDRAQDAQQAGQDTTARLYQVSLPITAPIASEGHEVRVTGRVGDDAITAALVGLHLTITDRYRGSEEWDRVYITEHNSG